MRENRVRVRTRGGANNVKFDEDKRKCVEEIVNENCLLTLRAITAQLRQRLLG
jgi:hypothetical protein